MATNCRVLLLPGLYNSGPEHWQTQWKAEYPEFVRLEQKDWETPDRRDWVETLQREIAAEASPVVLAAHSLSCCLVAHWAAAHAARQTNVRGALLVAPSDVEAPSYPSGTTGFAPMPLVSPEKKSELGEEVRTVDLTAPVKPQPDPRS